MHIELRHLRLILAIHETGSVAAAADRLHVTQSALSHQIKGIEDQVGLPLFVRRSRPLRLSVAGRRMLAVAERVLPEIRALRAEFEGLHEGRTGRLFAAVESSASLTWLIPVLDLFRRAWPEVDLDIRARLSHPPLEALLREEVDLVITGLPEAQPGIQHLPLFDYAPVCVVAADHPLAQRDSVTAEDFAGEALITYPLARERLDVFRHLLTPAGIEPESVRQVEMTQVILMLVASGRGIAVLPDWVMRGGTRRDLVARPLAQGGALRLFAAVRDDSATVPYIAHAVRLARQEAVRLQRG